MHQRINNIRQFEGYADMELVSRIVAGEAALYEIIIRRYNPYLFRVGRSYGFSHHDTQDLMQETYLAAYIHLKSFAGRSALRTWLVRIMLNHCYQRKQKYSYSKEMATDNTMEEIARPMFTDADNGKNMINTELGHVMENALHRIPEEYRLVFSLRELNGMNTAETAEALSISESNVKVRLNRAKNMLREEIEKFYAPEDIFEFNLIYCDKIVENVMRLINRQN